MQRCRRCAYRSRSPRRRRRPWRSVEHRALAVGGGYLQLDADALAAALPCRDGVLVEVVSVDLGQPGSEELIADPRVGASGGAIAARAFAGRCEPRWPRKGGYHQASKESRWVATAGSARGNQASSRPPPVADERLATPSCPASRAAAPIGWQTLWRRLRRRCRAGRCREARSLSGPRRRPRREPDQRAPRRRSAPVPENVGDLSSRRGRGPMVLP